MAAAAAAAPALEEISATPPGRAAEALVALLHFSGHPRNKQQARHGIFQISNVKSRLTIQLGAVTAKAQMFLRYQTQSQAVDLPSGIMPS